MSNTRLIDSNKKQVTVPTFCGLEYGDCFYNSNGDLCMKIDMYEAFNLTEGSKEDLEDDTSVLSANVEVRHFAIS